LSISRSSKDIISRKIDFIKDPFYIVILIASIYMIVFLYVPIIISITRIFSTDLSVMLILNSIPILIRTLIISAITTLISILIALVISYYLSFYTTYLEKIIFIIMITSSYWIGSLLKTYSLAYLIFLLENILGQRILYTDIAIYIGMIYNYSPLAIIPIFLAMERIDRIYIESARCLGAGETHIFMKVIMPMSKPGVLAGFLLVFTGSMGEIIIPQILGGSPRYMIGQWIYELTFSFKRVSDASLLSIIYLIISLATVISIYRKAGREVVIF